MPVVPLSALLGQPEVSAFLRGIVGRGRYGNAYLFHGPAGVGKGTAALAFARAALCERVPGAVPVTATPGPGPGPSLFGDAPPAPEDSAERTAPEAPHASEDDACGACGGCARSGTLQHPDLHFLFPVSGEEKDLAETVGETLQAWRDDPLFAFRYEKAASIRMSQTRELLRQMAYKPYEASRRVVVVRDCDRMREDQFSAMLKSIEEPGAATTWVLTTSRPTRVPATIRSRCQRVRFAPLAESTLREVLTGQAGVDEKQARMLGALAGGSLARALALREEDALDARNKALALLEPALAGQHAALWKTAQGALDFGRTGREGVRRMIEIHELWLRDLLRVRYGAPPETLVNRDRIADLRRLAASLDATEIRRRLLVLEEALRAIEGNVSLDLSLFSAMLRVAGERPGAGAWPPHATARWDY